MPSLRTSMHPLVGNRTDRSRGPIAWLVGLVVFSFLLVGFLASTSSAQGLGKSRYGTGKASVPKSENDGKAESRPDSSSPTPPGQAGAARKPSSDSATKAEAAEGSEDPAKDEKAKEEGEAAERPRGSLFGDTSRFNRVSGWGSIGAGMGQYGFSRSMLIMLPPVQEELKLTEEQKKQLRDWSNQMRKRGEEWGRSMRERNEGNDPFRNPNLPLAARILQFTTIMNQVSGLLKENETGFGRILSAGQRKRLNEISLQMEGISALARPEVAKALYLNQFQTDNIQRILAQSRMMQMTTWIEKMTTMAMKMPRRPPGEDSRGFGEGPGGGGREGAKEREREREPGESPGLTRPREDGLGGGIAAERDRRRGSEGARQEAGTAKAAKNDDEDEDEKPVDEAELARQRAERLKRAEDFRKEFESMRNTTDEIQDRTTRELLRVLTKRQRASFEKMLGEPFDPAKINTMGRPPSASGGRPAPSGPID